MAERSSETDQSDSTGISRRELISGAVATAALGGTAVAAKGDTAAQFLVGAAKRIITPDPLLPVSGGMGIPEPTHTKQGDLTVRALFLQRGTIRAAIVILDVLGFPAVLGDRVRARVPRIPASNILVGATHTHSAPDCYAFPDGKGGHTANLPYLDRICRLAADAVNEAIDAAQPARLRAATGVVRERIAYNYYAPDLYDRRLSVLQLVTLEGKPIATLTNFAVHPEVIGDSQGILSPDLCGPYYDRIEERAGGLALFVNGAQGGMVTADNRLLDRPKDAVRGYWEDARTWDECVRIGNALADESLRILDDAPTQDEPDLACKSLTVRLPVDSPELWAVVALSPLRYPHGRDRSITTRLSVLNLGNVQALTIPGEALPNIGCYLRRKMLGKHNMLFGLTNDAFGYILTRVDFLSFSRYEYISRVSLGEMTGEILLEKWLQLIRAAGAPGSRRSA